MNFGNPTSESLMTGNIISQVIRKEKLITKTDGTVPTEGAVSMAARDFTDEKSQRGRKEGFKATTKAEDKEILKVFHKLRPPGYTGAQAEREREREREGSKDRKTDRQETKKNEMRKTRNPETQGNKLADTQELTNNKNSEPQENRKTDKQSNTNMNRQMGEHTEKRNTQKTHNLEIPNK
jgi:hypothetical protein